MKILLLGSGGREHALAWKIAQSPKVEKLYIAPGNAGTTAVGENVNIKATDFEAISAFALKEDIAMVVVGPEDPLVKGIYDYFQNRPELKHIAVIGPSAQGAELEGSKEFAKGFMMRHNIPTARYKSITSATIEEGLAFLETLEAPYVLKADGLCAGKGVLILPTLDEAKKELKEMLIDALKEIGSSPEKNFEKEEPMNLKTTANWLGIAQSTLISYKRKKIVPYYQLPNSNKVRFYKSELVKVFQQNPELLQAARK